MKLLGSNINKITKDINKENVPYLKTIEAALVDYNIIINEVQQNSRVLHTFILKRSFGQLLDISPKCSYI